MKNNSQHGPDSQENDANDASTPMIGAVTSCDWLENVESERKEICSPMPDAESVNTSLHTEVVVQQRGDSEDELDYSTSGSDVFETNALAAWAQASGCEGLNFMSLANEDVLSSTSDESGSSLLALQSSPANEPSTVDTQEDVQGGVGTALSNSTMRVLKRNSAQLVIKEEEMKPHIGLIDENCLVSCASGQRPQELDDPTKQTELLGARASSHIRNTVQADTHLDSPARPPQQNSEHSKCHTYDEKGNRPNPQQPIWVSNNRDRV